MHEVLVNRLGGLSLPRKSVVRLTDRPDMTLDVYCGRKQQCNNATVMTVFCGGDTFSAVSHCVLGISSTLYTPECKQVLLECELVVYCRRHCSL